MAEVTTQGWICSECRETVFGSRLAAIFLEHKRDCSYLNTIWEYTLTFDGQPPEVEPTGQGIRDTDQGAHEDINASADEIEEQLPLTIATTYFRAAIRSGGFPLQRL